MTRPRRLLCMRPLAHRLPIVVFASPRRWRQAFACGLLMLVQIGCPGAATRVHLDRKLSVLTDARQRIITNTSAESQGDFYNRIQPRRIICAEPSPDVADSISRALTAAIEAGIERAGAGHGGGELTLVTAQRLAQLGERLATIQLLRDELSDLCRSYANGAVSTTTYTLRLAKLDRKMVTLLMGEMAAGSFGRSLAMSGGGARGAAFAAGHPAESVFQPIPGAIRHVGPPPEVAVELSRLQEQFLSHDDLGTLLDACLTSLDLRPRPHATDREEAEGRAQANHSALAAYCARDIETIREMIREQRGDNARLRKMRLEKSLFDRALPFCEKALFPADGAPAPEAAIRFCERWLSSSGEARRGAAVSPRPD